MEIAILGSALLLGLSVSLHCVGMCGPIALSLGASGLKAKFHLQNLLYQLGRAVTYAFLGAIIGAFTEVLQLLLYQDYISIFAGILIILMALFPVITNRWMAQSKGLNKLLAPMKLRLSVFLQRRSLGAKFLTGIFNGFLPCGPVYMALAGAFVAGGWWQAALFMFVFGLGTLPLMYIIVALGNQLQGKFRHKLYRWVPIMSILIGIFFILRGLHLGIPFLSPPKEMMEEKIEKIDENSTALVIPISDSVLGSYLDSDFDQKDYCRVSRI